jgi:glucuronoarabinoxylan endo-1,4-beta-xylanase
MTQNGGSLLDAHRGDWANRLATFAADMAAQGVPLVAISAQNEPNYRATWDTCIYTPAQLVTFVRDFLGPAMTAQGLSVPVMAPETQGWDQFERYADPLMADSSTHAMLGPIATHHYGGSPFDYAPAKAAGKPLWQTEVSDDKIVKEFDGSIDSGLRTAQMIHDNLVEGQVNAWHYWWLMPGTGGGNGALTQSMQLLPRAYAMGNWSRFVRPGFVRVAATPLAQSYLHVSAFHDPAGGRFVLVVINEQFRDLSQDFTIAGGTVAQLTPWVTSATQKLAAQAAVQVADGAFSVMLPARSVTSLVGTFSP